MRRPARACSSLHTTPTAVRLIGSQVSRLILGGGARLGRAGSRSRSIVLGSGLYYGWLWIAHTTAKSIKRSLPIETASLQSLAFARQPALVAAVESAALIYTRYLDLLSR